MVTKKPEQVYKLKIMIAFSYKSIAVDKTY